VATKLKSVDVVTVGVGLTATILAQELASTGLKVVGIERGRWRDTEHDFAMPGVHDELKYVRHKELMQDLSKETITFRNNASETALPMRQLGSFLPGEGVGGAAVHWGGLTWRFLPWDFETKSKTVERYGAKQVSDDCTMQDWGVSYQELEPHFNRFEQLLRDIGVFRGQVIGHPVAGQHEIAGVAAEILHAKSASFTKISGTADRMDAPEEAADPFPIVARSELRPAPATPREDCVSESAMHMQRLAILREGRNHGNFLCRKLRGKCVFLANRGVAPAIGPIEFGDQGLAALDPDLVHPIFVAVERQHPAVAAVMQGLDRIQHRFGR